MVMIMKMPHRNYGGLNKHKPRHPTQSHTQYEIHPNFHNIWLLFYFVFFMWLVQCVTLVIMRLRDFGIHETGRVITICLDNLKRIKYVVRM